MRSQADPNVILMAAADVSIPPGDGQRLRNQAGPNALPFEGDGDTERPRAPPARAERQVREQGDVYYRGTDSACAVRLIPT